MASGGQFWAVMRKGFLKGFCAMASSPFDDMEEMPLLFHSVYEYDAMNCSNHEGSLRTELMSLQWQSRKTEESGPSEVRVAESIYPWGLPAQVLILCKKINFPSNFQSKASQLI